MFGSPAVLKEIARLKKEGHLTDKSDLPLMPVQVAILKDLCLIFSIVAGDANIDATDILIQPKTPVRATRSEADSAFVYNQKLKTAHHQERSIVRRHGALVEWICTQDIPIEDILQRNKVARKALLKELVERTDTVENKIRNDIWNGTYVSITFPQR